ncbi:MAG TPA: YerC/YecD family TrpR-related protein [Negativicutes bacterium]
MSVNPKLKDNLTDQLFKAILLLENEEECYQFFEDICTISELKAMVQRLEVARMLKHGHTYDEIVERTGASTATISRIKRCLNYGADGYKIILARIDGDDTADQKENGV